MCFHTTPCSRLIVAHNPPASATCRLSWTQCRGAGCRHSPLNIFSNGFHRCQAIFQAASWPTPSSASTHAVPPAVTQKPISIPLKADTWAYALCNHPDQLFVAVLLDRIQHGFHIGLAQSTACYSSSQNSTSALEHSDVVNAFIEQQLAAGYMCGPFPSPDCSGVITSSLAVVPKKTPSKWRIIVNLSRPCNTSVNDIIRREFTHVTYSSVADATLIMHTLGHNTELAKIDLHDAYRIIPIHPEDRPFIGIKWRKQLYVDCQLPFSLASAPAIFCAAASTLKWILQQRDIQASIHYMDDFLLFGAHNSHECKDALATTLATSQDQLIY